jgi:hypothetical protein
MTRRGIAVEVLPVSGTLEQVLSRLLPLTGGETQRELFIPTRSGWTAYVEHGWTGTDADSPMSAMARRLSIRCHPEDGAFQHRRAGVHAGGGPRRPRFVVHPGSLGEGNSAARVVLTGSPTVARRWKSQGFPGSWRPR